MLKQALIAFSELALFAVGLALVTSGCTKTAPPDAANKNPPANPVVATAGTDASQEKQEKKVDNDSMEKAPLIPRDVLFGNPQRAQARISPDGKWLSFQAPVDGVLNVWVGPADDLAERLRA